MIQNTPQNKSGHDLQKVVVRVLGLLQALLEPEQQKHNEADLFVSGESALIPALKEEAVIPIGGHFGGQDSLKTILMLTKILEILTRLSDKMPAPSSEEIDHDALRETLAKRLMGLKKQRRSRKKTTIAQSP